MEMPIQILVVAIVLMVCAAVVIVFFSNQIFITTGFTQEENLCIAEFNTFCPAMGKEPGTWNVPKYRNQVTGETRSCAQILAAKGGCKCEEVNKVLVSKCPFNTWKP
jgi:hypothetical protein